MIEDGSGGSGFATLRPDGQSRNRTRAIYAAKVSPAGVYQAGLPSGPHAWIAEEAAFSDDAMSSEPGQVHANARPVQSIYLCSEDLTLIAPGNTTP